MAPITGKNNTNIDKNLPTQVVLVDSEKQVNN